MKLEVIPSYSRHQYQLDNLLDEKSVKYHKHCQAASSSIKYIYLTGQKGHLTANFTQFLVKQHSSQAQTSIFKQYKILLESDWRNCSSTVKHLNQSMGSYGRVCAISCGQFLWSSLTNATGPDPISMVTICMPYMVIVTIPIPNPYMIHILNKIYNPGKSTDNVVLGRNGQ